MRASELEYHAPARFDDLLEVFVRIARFGRTSVTYDHAAYRVEDDRLMVTAKQTLVLVDPAVRRTVEIPSGYRETVARLRGRGPGARERRPAPRRGA